MTYLDFLKSKIQLAPESGFTLDASELSTALKPHQRAAVLWALKGGRRALFESFGLGKTVQQLEWCRQVVRHEGGRARLYHRAKRGLFPGCGWVPERVGREGRNPVAV